MCTHVPGEVKGKCMRETSNKINRSHKDRLFCTIFQEKKELLSLYNALNGTDYTEEEDLTVNTLENAIYMTMKNDISFLIYGILNLYEHQSTWNPNMPLRDLLYMTKQLKRWIEKNGADLYGSKQVTIPTPQAVVFYNGKQKRPERQVLKLSDSFENKEVEGCLEFQCLVININYGENLQIMEKCKSLMGYATLIHKIRTYEEVEESLEFAVERAIEECIAEGALSDYLRENRSEVKDVVLCEYDEQKHIENEKNWSREEGRLEGLKVGRSEGIKLGNALTAILLKEKKLTELERCLQDRAYQQKLLKEYELLE